jgi:hypothetical protein
LHTGRALLKSAQFPDMLEDDDTLDAVIEKAMKALGQPSSTSVEKVAFALIHYTRMTPRVLEKLRKKYLPSFSNILWRDVFPYFSNTFDLSLFDDYRSIRPYALRRSRIPLPVFENLCRDMDISRRVLGNRKDLQNEAAIQLYYNPIPTTLLSLFHGRLINLPEHLLKGQISNSGRCEYTITFYGKLMLLFIEYKRSFEGDPTSHSDIVAQCIAEADGADSYNQAREYDGIPIHAILTDGRDFEFYQIDFTSWTALRGMGTVEEGIPWHDPYRITLPHTERASDYLAIFKVIVEVIFDTFVQSYISGVRAQLNYSLRRARTHQTPIGVGYRRRMSTNRWDDVHQGATNALEALRQAHNMRVVDVDLAEQTAERGIEILRQSVMNIPDHDTDWSLLDNWDERKGTILRV